MAGAFRLKSDLKMEDLLDLDSYRILVFDDLERSLMSPEELLGFINNFVEHDTKHVILIANEAELQNKENYPQIREKVIGISLLVKPVFGSALAEIRSKVSSSYSQFLEHAQPSLMAVIHEAGLKNIRVANHVLSEFVEIFDQILEAQISEDDAIQMFLTFFVLNYAYKTGQLSREDLFERNADDFTRAFRRNRDEYVPNALDRLSDAHPNVDVFSSAFDNEYLEEKIFDGFHNREKLSRTLGDLSGRSNSHKNPEWRNLWYLIHQSDDVIEESFARMMDKFQNQSYDDTGVIFHVFGLLHRMQEAGLLKWKAERIARERRRFISDKFHDRSLPLLGGDFLSSMRHGSAHGLGFTAVREVTFQEAATFYRAKSDELRNALLIEELNGIIQAQEFDLDRFRSIILQGAREDNVYNRPFLHTIDAKKLARSIMKETAEQQFEVLAALGSRYELSPYLEVRSAEAPWLRELIKALRSISRNCSRTTKFRIDEIIKWNLLAPSKDAEEDDPR